MLRVILLFILLANSAYSQNINTYIPKNAYIYMPVVITETTNYFNELINKEYVPGLIEQESCISLLFQSCWNPKVKLSTSRELGLGLGELTKTFNLNGSIRSDSLTDLRNRHFSELHDLNWNTLENRPDLQVRAIIIMSRDNYKYLYSSADEISRLSFTDAAYNGGLSGLQKEIRQCGLTKNCNPHIWFGNVEKVCLKSKKPIYGNRSACDINRQHVTAVIKNRMNKYNAFYK